MFTLAFDVQNAATIFASILFLLFLLFKYTTSRNFHAGPTGLPFVGYLPFMGRNPHLKLTALRKKYGDVFSVRLGLVHFVILGSYDTIKEAMSKYDELMPRPHNFDMMPNLDKWPGVVMNYGNSWAQIRRFSLSTLRNFGIGKSSMEPKIQDEIGFLIQRISQTQGQAIYVSDILRLSTTNTVCAILFGQRFDYEDETFKNLMKLAQQYTQEMRIDQIKTFVPTFLIKLLGIKDAGYYGTQLYESFLQIIEQRAQNHLPGADDSFIDVWLAEQSKGNADPNNFNKQQLAKVVWDLFMAASDTTAATLHWCLLYMTHYQEAQSKIHKEIDDKIGPDRTPNMIDQKQMPFTEAVILEVSRMVPIAALGVPRRALEDVMFCGHIIPKDAVIVPNLWSVHHDPSIYNQPEEFKPERFINEENKIVKPDELIAFGIGKRQCMGESLARMNVFLYLTSFLQHFSVKPASHSDINLVPKFGGLMQPKPQQICISSR